MARIEMSSEFVYAIEISNERLKKLQEQWSYEEICDFITTIINAQLAKSFNNEHTLRFAELNPPMHELFINGEHVT